MLRALGYFREYRDWRMIVFAGVLGVVIALTMMEIIDAHSMSAGSISLALAAVIGAFGICLVGAASAWRIRQELSAQNLRLDVALNNMNQGLCMFDSQGLLVVWNERYRRCTASIRSGSGAAALFEICSIAAFWPEHFRLTPAATMLICEPHSGKGRRSRSMLN